MYFFGAQIEDFTSGSEVEKIWVLSFFRWFDITNFKCSVHNICWLGSRGCGSFWGHPTWESAAKAPEQHTVAQVEKMVQTIQFLQPFGWLKLKVWFIFINFGWKHSTSYIVHKSLVQKNKECWHEKRIGREWCPRFWTIFCVLHIQGQVGCQRQTWEKIAVLQRESVGNDAQGFE